MTEFTLTDAERRRSITIVIITVSIVAVTLGLTWPLLSLILEARGVSSTMIGLSSASQTAALLLVIPLAPWMIGLGFKVEVSRNEALQVLQGLRTHRPAVVP